MMRSSSGVHLRALSEESLTLLILLCLLLWMLILLLLLLLLLLFCLACGEVGLLDLVNASLLSLVYPKESEYAGSEVAPVTTELLKVTVFS
jgi:hypothetical protein